MELHAEAESRSELDNFADKDQSRSAWSLLPNPKRNPEEDAEDEKPPEKIVKRRAFKNPQGRSLSLSQVSTIETMGTSQGQGESRRTSKTSGPGSRMSSKTSVQSATISNSAYSADSRPSSGNSRVLQNGGRGILKRVSTIEDPPTNSLEVGILSSRSSSCTPLCRRSSSAAASCEQQRRKSSLDMSPRTARRYLIHQHRMSMEGNLDQPHHRASRRGSFLGAESMAILEAKLGGHQDREEDDPRWCGFFRDDRVTTRNGPDADGPWKNMGVGLVEGPSEKKGYLNIYFEDAREMFSMKAVNLHNLTDASRSGKYASTVEEDKKYRARACGRKQGMTRAAAGAHRNLIDVPTIEAQEPTKYTFRDGLESAGLQVGDLVGSFLDGKRFQLLGTVIKEGEKPEEVVVRVGDLGMRVFNVRMLAKMEPDEERDNIKAAHRASYVNVKSRKRFTLTLDEASGPFHEEQKEKKKDMRTLCEEKEKERKQRDEAERILNEKLEVEKKVRVIGDPLSGFEVGNFVKVKSSVDSEMWKSLGIGVVRGPGKRPLTIEVQFDTGGEYWSLYADQLETVAKKDATDRVFRCTNHAMLKRRGSI